MPRKKSSRAHIVSTSNDDKNTPSPTINKKETIVSTRTETIEKEHIPVGVAIGERGDLNRFLHLSENVPDAALGQSFLVNEYQAFWTGLMFFTRLPCPPWVDHNLYWISRSTVFLPLIGMLLLLFFLSCFSTSG